MHGLDPPLVLHLPRSVLRGRQQAFALLRQDDLLQGQHHDPSLLVLGVLDRIRSGFYRNLFVAGASRRIKK